MSTVLNLYLAPKSGKSPIPSDEAIRRCLSYLAERGIIGPEITPSEYAAGPMAARIFHPDAEDYYVPAELTFESLTVQKVKKVTFLPEAQDLHEFHSVTCPICEDDMDPLAFKDALDRIVFFPLDAVLYDCPSCQSEMAFRDLSFGQNVAFARFWFHLEGVAFDRLQTQFVDALAKQLGVPLIVVPEVIDDQADAWAAPPGFR